MQISIALMMTIPCANEDIVLKATLFDCSIRKGHLADAMLDALLPFALIYGAIGPEHLTITISFVF